MKTPNTPQKARGNAHLSRLAGVPKTLDDSVSIGNLGRAARARNARRLNVPGVEVSVQ
jgi:hypothetical protein